MAQPDLDTLQAKLSELGIHSQLPVFAEYHILQNLIDIYRSHIVTTIHPFIDASPERIHNGLQWTNKLANGDLALVLPMLRLEAVEVTQYAKELGFKVSATT